MHHAHSLYCCDLDHGSSSSQPFSFEDLYSGVLPTPDSASAGDRVVACADGCADMGRRDSCSSDCVKICDEDCAEEECPQECPPDCTQECTQVCVPEWCPPDCTVEEIIKRCTDTTCTLPQVEIDPIALLLRQPQDPSYMDYVAQVFAQAQPQAPLQYPCKWQNCNASFDTCAKLAQHIAASHLPSDQLAHSSAPMPAHQPISTPMAQSALEPSLGTNAFMAMINALPGSLSQSASPASVPATMQADNLFGCLWADCFDFATGEAVASSVAGTAVTTPQSTVQTPSTAFTNHPAHGMPSHTHGEMSPQTLLKHLMTDHLGLPDPRTADNGHTHLVLTHLHSTSHPHAHPHPHHECAPGVPHDAHAHVLAHNHHVLGPHHHHSVPHRQLPTPSPSLSPSNTAHVCLWHDCSLREPFASSAELMAHLEEMHVGRGANEYCCRWAGCGDGEGRVFATRQKLIRHLRMHTQDRPFVCDECGQAFAEKAPLETHKRRHRDEKPFQCPYPGCGQAFTQKSGLNVHERKHTGVEPFRCDICGRGFKEASNLTKHRRTHTGEKPFACSHPGCGKRFARTDQLQRHMKIHGKGGVKKVARSWQALTVKAEAGVGFT
ncbi:uncharacterized protein CcaverHIS019_0202430 [Cutaneotrichosporon cavernicola]|uniref:C2H2-type domain-containing protein n=1 Tax=Cutaneotrichosporon cavernicola TaxID=279322 RepID=A0AA48KZP9_9TREE|nr:uncharacterized protein CcaverHIS019_0202430 [Cutaneotrichosporon cavernicola]BEI88881.1 hypothetical protein CcaverHIS019_0202430 [Cutaneotrichosporon cavernicola]BEI96658.1 hypothetical protein CcaverHIS631_0202470 [Cutaneotrichosporon cavernicola]BEJ04429.1 hypothetical protein CcaverHIS641_0202460 [Cutaneotrichosporon cavernicola]